MTEVVGVRFKDTGKTYYFDPGKLDIHKNDVVIVETARGTENGTAVYGKKKIWHESKKTESRKKKHIPFVKRRLRNINSI